MSEPLLTQALESDRDVVAARQRARLIARRLGFAPQDQTRIAIAVSEVARNAVQHAGRGVLEFALEQKDPQALAACVRDEGPGIAPEDQARLFERFFVAPGARGEATTGIGLGLPITLLIIEAHGGRIDVESQPGQGSTFRLVVPANGPSEVPPE